MWLEDLFTVDSLKTYKYLEAQANSLSGGDLFVEVLRDQISIKTGSSWSSFSCYEWKSISWPLRQNFDNFSLITRHKNESHSSRACRMARERRTASGCATRSTKEVTWWISTRRPMLSGHTVSCTAALPSRLYFDREHRVSGRTTLLRFIWEYQFWK